MKNNITYHKEGDYLIPNLTMKKYKPNKYYIGIYGHLKLEFIRQHKKGLYTELMINGNLQDYLANINEEASNRITIIINQFTKEEGINEELKATNQMEWVQAMNNIKNRAEEIVLKELIYV